MADKVLQDPLGQKAIYRAYDLLAAISIGTMQKLKALHERVDDYTIVPKKATKAVSRGTPLLPEEGWQEVPGWWEKWGG